MKKPLLIALSCATLVVSCSKNCEFWKHHEVKTYLPKFRSQRIYACPEDIYYGIELEFIKDYYSSESYVNIFEGSIPPIESNPCFAKVHLEIGPSSYSFIARRFKGGQRLLLPQKYTQMIIQGLLASKCCTIKLEGGYKGEFFPKNFHKEWNRRAPLFTAPYLFKE